MVLLAFLQGQQAFKAGIPLARDMTTMEVMMRLVKISGRVI